jgi:hypothetical protein
LIDELFKTHPDSLLIRQLVENLGRKQAEFDMNIFEHFLKIRDICSLEQQEKLKQLMLDFMSKAKGPGMPDGPDRTPIPLISPGNGSPSPMGNPPPPGQNQPPPRRP